MQKSPYTYRGFMLDVARHYMPMDEIRRILRAATLCGMNVMHWHLVDDQGWRLEIKKWPRLTQVGSVRGESFFAAPCETENNTGFYTQDEVKELVALANELNVTIVPEIELPGHAAAMLAAYPQFGCRRELPGGAVIDAPYDYSVITAPGVFPQLLCGGRDDAFAFFRDILSEVCDLFPGPYMHIGGDEAIKLHWRRCPDCQKRIREHGLKDVHDLQRDLVLRAGEYLRSRGKRTIVWNESLAGGRLPNHFIVQHWWGNDSETADFMAHGGQVICSDTEYSYISRPYGDIDVSTIYHSPAVPDWAQAHPENLLGLECPLWSEKVTNPARAQYMLFPRLAATALKAMHPGDLPPWDEFVAELRSLQARWQALGVHGAPEGMWQISPEEAAAEKAQRDALLSLPQAKDFFRVCDGLLLQEKIEQRLDDLHTPRALALQVMDCTLNRLAPEYAPPMLEAASPQASDMAAQLINELNG